MTHATPSTSKRPPRKSVVALCASVGMHAMLAVLMLRATPRPVSIPIERVEASVTATAFETLPASAPGADSATRAPVVPTQRTAPAVAARLAPPTRETAIWSARLERRVTAVRAQFEEMTRAPAPPDDEPHDDARFGSIAVSGHGAGGGCAADDDCRTVAARIELGDRWRPRGEQLARRVLQARASVDPVLRAPEPEMGELTRTDVQREVRHALLADVVRCYSARTEHTPLAAGRVVVRFAIGASGRVSEPTVISTAIHDAPTERCITAVIGAHAFPPSREGAAVEYPFVFSSLLPDP